MHSQDKLFPSLTASNAACLYAQSVSYRVYGDTARVARSRFVGQPIQVLNRDFNALKTNIRQAKKKPAFTFSGELSRTRVPTVFDEQQDGSKRNFRIRRFLRRGGVVGSPTAALVDPKRCLEYAVPGAHTKTRFSEGPERLSLRYAPFRREINRALVRRKREGLEFETGRCAERKSGRSLRKIVRANSDPMLTRTSRV